MRTGKFIGSQKFYLVVILLFLFAAVTYLSSALIVSGGERLPTGRDLTLGGFFAANAIFWLWVRRRALKGK